MSTADETKPTWCIFCSGGTPPIVVHGHLDGILRLHWTGPKQGNSKCESRNELATASKGSPT